MPIDSSTTPPPTRQAPEVPIFGIGGQLLPEIIPEPQVAARDRAELAFLLEGTGGRGDAAIH